MQLAPDLYAYPWNNPQMNNCNSYLIGGQAPILVDPGMAQLYGHVENGLAGDGIRVEPALVVLTHAHPDHIQAAILLGQQGAKIAMHQTDWEFLQGEGRQLAAMLGMDASQLEVDFFLEPGELTAGEHTLEVFHTPGHSPGHVCLYWPEAKALAAGDLVFARGVGRVDFPGGDGEALKESILRMAELDLEWVLPGHGPILKGAPGISQNFALIRDHYFSVL